MFRFVRSSSERGFVVREKRRQVVRPFVTPGSDWGWRRVKRLFDRTVRRLATPQTPGAFYQGMRLMGIDGVVFNLPDRPANDTTFGRPSGGERGEGAFPQLRKVSLVELGTHVEVAFVAKPITTGEQAALPALLKRVPPDALLLEDRGFFGYEHWKQAISREIRLLVRVKNNLILHPIKHLSDGSHLAKIYPRPYVRQKDRGGIVVRVIRYKLDDPQRVGHDGEHVLMTNLWDERFYPAEELIPLYHERWEEELVFDEQKNPPGSTSRHQTGQACEAKHPPA